MSTSRDFRINAVSLQAAIDRNEQSDNNEEEDALDHVSNLLLIILLQCAD